CDPATEKRRGFEWFGGNGTPHAGLTAYGYLQMNDLARYEAVDRALVERTRRYLLGFPAKQGGPITAVPDAASRAYALWALTESGKDDVGRPLRSLGDQARTSPDPYFLSLVAASQANRKKGDEAVRLLDRVAALQQADGHLEGAASITGSRGRDLRVETTALAVLGWLKADPKRFDAPARKALRWLRQQRGGDGTFGSTQATVLALKALAADAGRRPPVAAGGE